MPSGKKEPSIRESTRVKYDAFCRSYHLNGHNGAQAAIDAGYSAKTARQKAAKLLTIVYIKEKLRALEDQAADKYSISVEKRMMWLEKIVNCGLREIPISTFVDKDKDKDFPTKAENLPASVAAIKELNLMLGTTSEEEAPPLHITYEVAQPVMEVKTTNART